ncbi:L,D-transpeptidase [Clostridium septicum]|uniref:L,D-transpeptidase n=1 Tax=Clostridium septicum TaxID=1504 RepID=UPI00272E750F|nr:L,D-transpeptidase [Clostridium septicum]WLF69493.1 L,D-transpeptidase [Clostridium septicum]
MKIKSNTRNKKKKNFSLFKLISLFLFFIVLGAFTNIYLSNNYYNKVNEFYYSFNKCDFNTAQSKLASQSLFIKFHKNKYNQDLNNYFTGVIKKVCNSVKSGEITDNQALAILTEIKKYDVLNSSLDKLIASFDSNYASNSNKEDISNITNESLKSGIEALNNKDFLKAMSYFNSISKDNKKDFNSAKEYIHKTKEIYKNELITKSDELIANKYYTKAIELLSSYDTNILGENNKDINDKIHFVKMVKDEYLANIANEDSEYTSNAILQSITIDNVNALNIESKTPYFIYVNLLQQKTYIYEGAINNWKLIKIFESSTGLPGKETPKGVFAITGRGEWFFSEEFMQGGKYWVQFMGDYLFHSIPFNQDQSKIVDSTLGTPASHGCIRLEVDASKWLYDNAPNDTKIIIN